MDSLFLGHAHFKVLTPTTFLAQHLQFEDQSDNDIYYVPLYYNLYIYIHNMINYERDMYVYET